MRAVQKVGNHQNWKRTLGIAIRVVRYGHCPVLTVVGGCRRVATALLQLVSVPARITRPPHSAAWPPWGPTDPNGWRSGHNGVPRCPNSLLCAPDRLQSVMDPDRVPSARYGAVSDRFWPFVTGWGPFGPVMGLFGWGRDGAEWGCGPGPKNGIRGGHH